jgi:hypothetical protein
VNRLDGHVSYFGMDRRLHFSDLRQLTDSGQLTEITGMKRNRLYGNQSYLRITNEE